jgi:hypothetical protein
MSIAESSADTFPAVYALQPADASPPLRVFSRSLPGR